MDDRWCNGQCADGKWRASDPTAGHDNGPYLVDHHYVRIPKTPDVSGAVKKLEDIFKKYNPDYPFEYRFADVEFQEKFSAIEMTSRLSGAFAVLAIIVTALGLFGMASFTAEQRTKEIGIRKVPWCVSIQSAFPSHKRFFKNGCDCFFDQRSSRVVGWN